MQDVLNGGRIEIGGSGDAALIGQYETPRKRLHGPSDTISAGAAKLDEILRRRKSD
jgi:hypothetical protein